jgi:hypothetical protein
MPVNTRQKQYDNGFVQTNNKPSNNDRCPSPFLRVSVGNCKYRRVLVENVEIVDRGRTQIFSPLSIKDRLRSASRKSFDIILM